VASVIISVSSFTKGYSVISEPSAATPMALNVVPDISTVLERVSALELPDDNFELDSAGLSGTLNVRYGILHKLQRSSFKCFSFKDSEILEKFVTEHI
jgi:hypothetical protein